MTNTSLFCYHLRTHKNQKVHPVCNRSVALPTHNSSGMCALGNKTLSMTLQLRRMLHSKSVSQHNVLTYIHVAINTNISRVWLTYFGIIFCFLINQESYLFQNKMICLYTKLNHTCIHSHKLTHSYAKRTTEYNTNKKNEIKVD